jgi:hypothetical protein
MSERGEIKRDGATAQKNSGRGQIQKGDARLGPFIVDYKEYPTGFSVNRDVWAKICGDAWRSRGEPALKIVLGEGNSKVRLVVISEMMFDQMREAWEEKYGA